LNVADGTIETTGTVSGELQNIENDVSLAAGIGAAVGGPIGAAVDAGVTGVEGVVNDVVARAPHQTALTDIGNAVSDATPIITEAAAGLTSAANASRITTGLSVIQSILAEIEGLFGHKAA
jgi:hypothetical protein